MRKTILALGTIASFAALPVLAQDAASSRLNSGNVERPELAVPGAGDASGGERNSNRSDATGSVAGPQIGVSPGSTGAGGSQAVPGSGTAPGTPAR